MQRNIEQEREILAHFENEGGSVAHDDFETLDKRAESIFAPPKPKEPEFSDAAVPTGPTFRFNYIIRPEREDETEFKKGIIKFNGAIWYGDINDGQDFFETTTDSRAETERQLVQWAELRARAEKRRIDTEVAPTRGKLFVSLPTSDGPAVVRYG